MNLLFIDNPQGLFPSHFPDTIWKHKLVLHHKSLSCPHNFLLSFACAELCCRWWLHLSVPFLHVCACGSWTASQRWSKVTVRNAPVNKVNVQNENTHAVKPYKILQCGLINAVCEPQLPYFAICYLLTAFWCLMCCPTFRTTEWWMAGWQALIAWCWNVWITARSVWPPFNPRLLFTQTQPPQYIFECGAWEYWKLL